MVAAAVMNLCSTALKFNPEKSSNPFSYYTTAIMNSFSQYKADEKKHRNIRDALLVDAGSNPSFNFLENERDERDFEIKESDEHALPIEEPETVVVDEELSAEQREDAAHAANRAAEIVAGMVEEQKEAIRIERKKLSVRQESRQHGAVTKIDPKTLIIDEAGNIIGVKPVEEKKPKTKRIVVKTPNDRAPKLKLPKVAKKAKVAPVVDTPPSPKRNAYKKATKLATKDMKVANAMAAEIKHAKKKATKKVAKHA
jgi:hypothetical protein